MRPQSKQFHLLLVLTLLFLAAACERKEERQPIAVESSPQQTQPYITTKDAKVMSGPGAQYKTVAEIKSDTKVNVAGREGRWLKVVSKRGNPPGYIEETSARPYNVQARQAAAPAQGSYMTTAEVNVREGPGSNYKIVAKIPKGVKIQVVGAEGDWLKVQSKHGNPPGYVDRRYAQRQSG